MTNTCPLETAYGGPGPIAYCTNPAYAGSRRDARGQGWCASHLVEWGWADSPAAFAEAERQDAGR